MHGHPWKAHSTFNSEKMTPYTLKKMKTGKRCPWAWTVDKTGWSQKAETPEQQLIPQIQVK